MDLNNPIDPSGGQEVNDNKKATFFILTWFISLPLIFIVFVVLLNYFNILTLNKIFPQYLGWLPQQATGVQDQSNELRQEENTVERELILYAREILKPEISNEAVSLLDNESDSVIFNVDKDNYGTESLSLVYSYIHKQAELSLKIGFQESGHDVYDLEEVINVFNKYFDMPDYELSDWVVSEDPSYDVPTRYELIFNEDEDGFESRSAFALQNDETQRYLIIVTACRIKAGSTAFDNRSCFSAD